MSMIRPEILDGLYRRREAVAAIVVIAVGAWIFSAGTIVMLIFGGVVMISGAALGMVALRRLRFGAGGADPGVVKLIEGQIAYFGPEEGGFAALAEIEEIRIEPTANGRLWVLSQADGSELAIPVGAAGADILFDAFATLPGIRMNTLLNALEAETGSPRVLWRRKPRAALT